MLEAGIRKRDPAARRISWALKYLPGVLNQRLNILVFVFLGENSDDFDAIDGPALIAGVIAFPLAEPL
jgi:hypothetical protein